MTTAEGKNIMENKKSNIRLIILFAILMVIIFGNVFVIGLTKYLKVQTLIKNCTVATNGIITKVERTQQLWQASATWVNSYHIEADFYLNDVKYTTVADERRGKNDHGQNARFHTNTTVTIMYNPENPNESYIKAAAMDTGKQEMLSVVLVPAIFIYLTIDYKIKKRKENELG